MKLSELRERYRRPPPAPESDGRPELVDGDFESTASGNWAPGSPSLLHKKTAENKYGIGGRSYFVLKISTQVLERLEHRAGDWVADWVAERSVAIGGWPEGTVVRQNTDGSPELAAPNGDACRLGFQRDEQEGVMVVRAPEYLGPKLEKVEMEYGLAVPPPSV